MGWMSPVALIAAALGLLAPASATTPDYDRYLTPDRMVEIAPGRRLNLRCEGRGSPTVLLEAGLGYPSLSWRDTQPKLARTHRTCSYDRAGLGFSDAGPMPRSAGAIVDDLERLIAKAGLAPPFILVGNSMGGQTVRLYAFRHPDKVAGLVLLDPYVEGQFRSLSAIEPAIGRELRDSERDEAACIAELRRGELSGEEAERRGCIAGENGSFSPRLNVFLRNQRMMPRHFEAVRSESQMLETVNERQVQQAERPLPMPIIVLSASRNYDAAEYDATRDRLLAEQLRLHRRLADLSPKGDVRMVASEHVIQVSAPDAVVSAVDDIVGQTRR